MELALFLFCRKIFAANFPGRLLYYGLVFTALQRSRIFGIGILCVRVLLSADRVIQQFHSLSLASVRLTKNLLFILRIYFQHFHFWIDFFCPFFIFFKRSWNFLHLSLLCSIFIKSSSILNSSFRHDSQRCLSACYHTYIYRCFLSFHLCQLRCK